MSLKGTPTLLHTIVLAVVVTALPMGGFLLGRLTAITPPGENSADAGFVRDMRVHRAQAVLISDIIRERSQDPAITMLAFDIAMTQQHQAG